MCKSEFLLSGYIVEKTLNSGGHGVCYQVRHNGVCYILKDYKRDDEKECRHEVQVYKDLHGNGKGNEWFFKAEHLVFNGKNYLLLQTHEGETMAEFLSKQRNASLTEKLDLLIKTCYAVNEIHKNGYIHLDIKPSNLYVSESKSVVTPIDMGSAVKINRSKKNNYKEFIDVMESMGYLSTDAYASLRVCEFNFQREKCRELFRKENNDRLITYPYVPLKIAENLCYLEKQISIKDDIYSLLCCVFFVLTDGVEFKFGSGDPKFNSTSEIKKILIRSHIPNYLTDRLADLFMLLYEPSIQINKEIKFDSVEELIKELTTVKEIEENQGFHPEVLLRNAQKYKQHFSDIEIDPELLTDVEIITN